MLRLTLTPDLGPIRIRRLIERFGSAVEVLAASGAELAAVKLGGRAVPRPDRLVAALRESEGLAHQELELAARLGVRIVAVGGPGYPELLGSIPNPPPIIYVRGEIHAATADRYPVAIVGSRHCSAYGIEQSERFASVLGQAGLTIVSGGARGIDTAAHRGSIRLPAGRTVAVLGCGLAHCYPPENAAMFDEIASGRGAIISELPLRTAPAAENFPARNRIISGMSLGVIVIEAGDRSGALITARLAAEDHGREVMAVPGRVDSPASVGTLKLLKAGGATLVTEPGDVIELLETPARHHFAGTHAVRYTPLTSDADGGHGEPARIDHLPAEGDDRPPPESMLFDVSGLRSGATPRPEVDVATEPDPLRRAVLGALAEPLSIDELASKLGADAGGLRGVMTMLEIERRVVREGAKFRRR